MVPFGGIEKNREIKWSDKASTIMSVAGFMEVFNSALEFKLNESVTFKVVTLSGLLILKFIAWSERSLSTQKDAEDINYILRNYSTINTDSLFNEHLDIISSKDYNLSRCSNLS